ncbi:MAG: hypothetical protein JW864_11680 [Spirochaetes bacterium]|nr:hypothetical protein [Spirochaetota bacterium]
MKITEFEIKKYGPLNNIKKIKPGSFNLFFGKNENGKTLTIDALIKFLLGKRARDFKQTDRVSEDPSGFLRLNMESLGELRLPDDGDLASITKKTEFPVSSQDCRNIFIIRNSDLTIPDESKFYTGITDRLVGLRTTDINKIRRNLMDAGSLTPGMGFSDDEKSGKLKTRITKAGALIERIEKVKTRLLASSYDDLELNFYKKSREKANTDAVIVLYEEARNRALYENSIEMLRGIEENISSLKKMELFREEDANTWQNSEREIKRAEEEINDLKQREKQLITDIAGLKKETESLKTNINILDKKKSGLDNEKLKLKNLEEDLNRSASDSSLPRLLKRASVMSWIIAAAVIASWFMNPSVYSYIAGIIAVLIASGLCIYEISLILKKRSLAGRLSGILFNLSEKGIRADNIREAVAALGKFSEDYEKMQMRFRGVESELVTSERHLKEIGGKVAELREITDRHDRNILSIKSKSGISAIDEYRDMLSRRKARERERDSIVDRLAGMLEIQGRSYGEIMKNIKSRVDEMETFRDKGAGIKYDLKSYNDLKQKAAGLEHELGEMKEKLDLIGAEMNNLEAAVNDILTDSDEWIYCRTLVDLNEIYGRLKTFADENGYRKKVLAETINLISEIETEEKGRVTELFNSVPAIYKVFTAGAYDDVIFDPENESVSVKKNDGEIIDAEKLSGGAYDQLYLAIRLAMGERLLNQEKGFFIMDDPFIKSDIDRIARQMNVIKKISQIGWQILYFSCKNEIKNILSKDIEEGSVQYLDINWLNN